ncbi:MAG: FKBP-type peptidyl-prolyl cis-trans isomerase [Oscillospiraceae bacterium]|jgi:trigger factor|nr:FKBP-type peptidyl-prolyl cis-trans isomerase [Oscillospiraceae bacterium]
MKLTAKKTVALLLALTALAALCTGCSQIKDKLSKSKWDALRPYASYKLANYIELGDYSGITVDLYSENDTIPQSEVIKQAKAYFDNYKQQNYGQELMEVQEDKAKTKVAEGDAVLLDYDGTAEGVTVSEQTQTGLKGQAALVIGSNSFIPGFEAQVVGKEPKKEFTVSVTFPEDYSNELAGKPVTFKCTVQKIGTMVITDTSVSTLTSGQITTVNDFFAEVKTRLLEYRTGTLNPNLAFEAAFKNATIKEVPEREVEYYRERIKKMLESSEETFDAYLKEIGQTEDEWLQDSKDQISRELFCYAIAQKEKLTITADEKKTYIEQLRQNYTDLANLDDTALIETAFSDEGTLERNMMFTKVSEFIAGKAVASGKMPSQAEVAEAASEAEAESTPAGENSTAA